MENDRKWEVLQSRYLIRRPWLTARVDRVKLPTGVINEEYYVLEYLDWVNVIALTRDRKFVLVRQYRHALGETHFELCAGVCEKGELPLESARRELLEETGYGRGRWREWMTLTANASTMTNLTHCFLAEDVEPVTAPHLDATEDLTAHLKTRDEVFRLLTSGDIKQALMAAPLWKYFAVTGNNL